MAMLGLLPNQHSLAGVKLREGAMNASVMCSGYVCADASMMCFALQELNVSLRPRPSCLVVWL